MILGVAVLAVICIVNYRHTSVMEAAELRADDLRMHSRPELGPTGSVAVVTIDDKSIASVGQWPWPRREMARLISALSDYKVSVIGIDLLFPEPDREDVKDKVLESRLAAAGVSPSTIEAALGPENDVAFAKAMAEQGSTYLAYAFEGHQFIFIENNPGVRREFTGAIRNPPPVTFDRTHYKAGPLPQLFNANAYLPPIQELNQKARGTAFVDVDTDVDGVVRQIPAVIRFDKRFCAPFFLALASAYRGHAELDLYLTKSRVDAVTIGGENVPVDEIGRMLVDFRGRLGSIPTFSVIDVLEHRVAADSLKSKVVLVGMTAHGLGDRKVTPLGGDVSGVEIHAAAVDNVLSGRFVRRSEATEGGAVVAALILGLAMTLAISQLTAMRSAMAGIVLIAGYIAYAQYRLLVDGALIGIVLPLLTVAIIFAVLTAYGYVTEGLAKRRLRQAFVHYLAPSLVDRLAADPAELKLGGEQRIITMMFADLTGFTNASTRMGPEQLTSKVNRYFGFIVQPIYESGGYVERYLGDSALAFWGAPVSDPNHAIHAVTAAFKVIDGVKRAREADEARGEEGFTIKVGINTGPAIVGNIGSEHHYSYTAMGEDVNLAARLESVPSVYGCLIAIGEHTADLVKQRLLLRELDWILVKGAAHKLTIYQPIAPVETATDEERDLVARYAAALENYRAMRFAEAAALWDKLVAKVEPAPSPSSVMAARARHFIIDPPPAGWDGVFVMVGK